MPVMWQPERQSGFNRVGHEPAEGARAGAQQCDLQSSHIGYH